MTHRSTPGPVVRSGSGTGASGRDRTDAAGSDAAGGRLLREGQRIADAYLVERYLGRGAHAEVYRVWHRFLGRQAMKVFKQVGDLAAVEEMLSEAVLLSRLGHPNIVRVFDAGTVPTPTGERAFFTMEYVAGGSLHRFWAAHRDRFVPVEDTVRILRQVSAGLAVAHAERPPVVHRDVTTENILVGHDAHGLRARLGDFGLATPARLPGARVSGQGVRAFKAPEALVGRLGDSPAGDVWAVGVVGYLLLTDRLPYPKGYAGWLSGAYPGAPLEPPGRFNPEVDERLERIVLDALRVDRWRRTPDAGALAEQLTGWRPAREGKAGPVGTTGGRGPETTANAPETPRVPGTGDASKTTSDVPGTSDAPGTGAGCAAAEGRAAARAAGRWSARGPAPPYDRRGPPPDRRPPAPYDRESAPARDRAPAPPAAPADEPVARSQAVSESRARALADRALELGAQAGSLADAADLMEEAVTASARLRARYGARLLMWRRGVVG